MRTLLAIDTSTEACSVALWNQGELTECFDIAPQKHNKVVFPMIESLLAQNGVPLSQIDAFAFGRGPGSFTGVRIATSLIQGFAVALDRPVYPISTLAALAWQQKHHLGSKVLSAMDARMSQIYWGLFHITPSGVIALGEEHVSYPSTLTHSLVNTPVIGVGSGWQYADAIPITPNIVDAGALPRAQAMVHLTLQGNTSPVDAAQVEPTYVRNTVVQTKT